MPGLEDLYREIILDHYRSPRNRGELETPPAIRADGFNPLCGDEIVVYIDVDDAGIITDVAIGGQGCSISQSSAFPSGAFVAGHINTMIATPTEQSPNSVKTSATTAHKIRLPEFIARPHRVARSISWQPDATLIVRSV